METLRRLRILYVTQFELLWNWRPGRRALVRRALISFLVSLVALGITVWLLPNLQIADVASAIIAVLVLAGLNLLIRPLILGVVAGRSIAVVGILTILWQVVAILLLNSLVPGLTLTGGFLGALLVSFVYAFINTAIGGVFALNEDDSYYGALVRSLASRRRDVVHTDQPGLVVIQLDGLSHDVMTHSVRAGRVPVMARWLRDGSHRLGHWEALLPSTTPASQAGILQGTNDGIPNFRWWEKENGRLLVANHPEDATEIERRLTRGDGLLSPGGASISNIFTGDAKRAFLVMSTIKVKDRGLGQSEAFYWFFVSPYSYLNMIARYLGEVIKENIQARRQARAGIVPRMHRGFPYPWVRAATNVAMRALGTSLVIQEMLRGTPVIYMDYTDYDEIAHHSGPERPESLDALDGVDRELGTLEKAAQDAPRPYRFVVLADHGQSLGQTFLQRYGVTLQEVVRSLMGGPASVAAATASVEDWGQLNAFMTEVTQTRGVTGAIARAATRRRSKGGVVDLGPREAVTAPAGAPTPDTSPETEPGAGAGQGKDLDKPTKQPADLVVVAGGNLGLIYFNVRPTRLSAEQIAALHPGLVEALANHPGVGVLMVRSERFGPLCVGKKGIHYLDDDRVEGEDPLAPYGEYAVRAFKRLDEIEHVGDIAVISLYDEETYEIAAFEELIGAHGGLGGPQTRPFLVYPADWTLDLAPLVGAPMVYQQLRRWMERELGLQFPARTAGATAAAATAATETPPSANATAASEA
ncbi:MAG TPA: phage holin family protein [Candidatus Dormibacteraeota bacterium]|nr:phage holin family protein [Candidatus Dormibacteraeota bacterium]